MKQITTFTMGAFFICLCTDLHAQHSISLSGKPVIGSVLNINSGETEPAKVEWKLNGKTIASMMGSARQGVTVAGGNGPGNAPNQLYYPNGVFVDKDDNIWVADASNGRVQKWAPGATAGVTIGFNLPNRPGFPVNVFVCHDGVVYVADYFGGGVKRLAKNGTKWVTVAGQSGEIDLSRGLWVDKQGNVYTTNYGFYFAGDCCKLDGMVLKYPPGSSQWQIVAGGNGAGSALNQFSIPTNIMLDEDGNIYVADGPNDHGMNNARVVKWAPGATEGVVVAGGNGVGHAANQCGSPGYAFADKNGNVYVSNGNYNEVQKWAAGATKGKIVAGGNGAGSAANQLNGNLGIFLKGKYLYVVDDNNHRVQRFDLSEPNHIAPFTATRPGIYTAVVTFEDGSEAVSNSIYVSAAVTREASITKSDVFAYPNPTKNTVTIGYIAEKTTTYIFEIIASDGKALLHKQVTAVKGSNHTSLDISRFAGGMYFIHIIKPDRSKETIKLSKE